ncbi:hypothetical protein CCHL11_08286 [Colletotrichum chlorophyti]|uniref:Uncharacterized protein n=1 Tax=Colletotrichum chlorophyti TaxID=708187 RepID=A0A1Q8RNB5_9PEZI|nr:hypothetical protein CCHL11_08286 [Colletotrichum chlorophyti]
MRTHRKLHDVAACVLYSGYYYLGHPSQALDFLKALDPKFEQTSPDPKYTTSRRAQKVVANPEHARWHLVRHADLTTNRMRSDDTSGWVDIPWNPDAWNVSAAEQWIIDLSKSLGIEFCKSWCMPKVSEGRGSWDHAMELINQLFIREPPPPEATTPNLRSLEVHKTNCYEIPKGLRLENLRSLKFVACDGTVRSMKRVLKATAYITHFEYSFRRSDAGGDGPMLTPQSLCELLSNQYDLADPPYGISIRGSLGRRHRLPDFHKQLRSLKIDFYRVGEPWKWAGKETISDIQHFSNLRYLSIDTHSFAFIHHSGAKRMVNPLADLIPDGLEVLVVTRVHDLLYTLISTVLPVIRKAQHDGEGSGDRGFRWLRRIEFQDVYLNTNAQYKNRYSPAHIPDII